jgi:hypothetical protein
MYLTEPVERDRLILMPAAVNVDAKNLLAKLLASENIWIQHRKVETAYFDMVNRVLTFPMWKEMSDVVYTLLAGHETSHALNTYDVVAGKDGKIARANLPASDYGKRIDPKNLEVACAYWNIVEDARIERLIKHSYPGLKAIFAQGYEELYKSDMFALTGRDLDTLPLIDRINLYFKIGHLLQLHFTTEEESLRLKVATTLTMDDVVAVAKEIYDWSKQNETQPPPPVTMKMTMEEFEEFMEKMEKMPKAPGQRGQKIKIEITDAPDGDEKEDDGDEGDENDGDSKPGKKGKSGKSKKPSNEDGDDSEEGDESGAGSGSDEGDDEEGNDGDEENGDKGDKGGKGKGKDKGKDKKGGKDKKDAGKNGDGEDDEDGDGDDSGDEGKDAGGKDGKEGKKKNGGKQVGKQTGTGREATKPVDPGPPPKPNTQQTFDQKLRKILHDPNAQEIVYVTLPKPNLKNIVVDWSVVHKNIRKHFNKQAIVQAEKDFATFREAEMPKIDYILQQFEMRKQADRYKRTKQHRTGSLDTLRLHSYRTEEDLFKTIAVCTDGKNHGLVFVVDWSSSMHGQMAGTLEQLIAHCLFSRKAQIPFEVYSLTTGGSNAFSREPLNLEYAQNFRMRMYLSSRMTPGEFHEACINLFALMPNGTFAGGPNEDNLIGCTPLDESIITSIELVKEFRRKTNAQIVNAIFLTDGGANTVSQYLNESGRSTSMFGGGGYYSYNRQPNTNTKYLIDDRETHKVYGFTVGEMTPTMVKILRDRNNIHAVCFYVDGSWEHFFTNVDDKKRKEAAKQYNEDGYVISTEWGFDEVYILKRTSWRITDTKMKPSKVEPGTPEFLKKAQENFIKQGQQLMKQRIMLDRFIKMIA